jgi:hypothetical protein
MTAVLKGASLGHPCKALLADKSWNRNQSESVQHIVTSTGRPVDAFLLLRIHAHAFLFSAYSHTATVHT